MKLTDDELSDEYKRGMEHLTQFLADRERYRTTIKAAQDRGQHIAPADHAYTLSKLAEFDKIIDGLEKELAKEYDRLVAEKAKKAEMSAHLAKGWEAAKFAYLIVKHHTPHKLEEFEKCLDPFDDDQREQFLDEVAILEATNLNAILKGEA